MSELPGVQDKEIRNAELQEKKQVYWKVWVKTMKRRVERNPEVGSKSWELQAL